MTSARRAAWDALTAVTRDGAYTALALKEHLPENMQDADKRFASALMRTTLENLMRLDYALDRHIKTKRVHASVRNVLRIGACQILLMNAPEHAAVSESVKLMKEIKPPMAGFVNAVLRALIRDKHSIVWPKGENAQALSIAYSYPVWICEKYISDFGYDFTKAMMSEPARKGTAVRMNPLRTNTADFEAALNARGIAYTAGSVENAYIIEGLSDIEHFDLYRNGGLAVQSESAMRAVLMTGVKPGARWLDCCAAPGGKSAYAAALAGNTLDILAWDIHPHRVEMTKKNFTRLGVANAQACVHDAIYFDPDHAETFDAVVVDAPCSAMGLMGKNPDIRYARKPGDIEELSRIQLDILSACAGYVKKGGTLAYYTCSINREENEQVTEKFLSTHDGFAYSAPPVTLYPHLIGSDGFYIAVMKRKP